MSDNLSKYILTTVAYYDVMDFPMTGFEIWKYLTAINQQPTTDNRQQEGYGLGDVLKELDSNEKLKHFIEEYRGYYFLRGRKDLVAQRIERNKISQRKIRIVKKVVRWLRFVPFVRSVAVAGRLAMKNAESKSDLDLLVILKKGRIFTGRLLVTLVVHILGKRRHGHRISNRICLNHFITTKGEISGRDLFGAHEYAFLMPIFGAKAFSKFHTRNGWIRRYKLNFQPAARVSDMVSDNRLARSVRKSLEKILDFDRIEEFLGGLQKKKIANNPKTRQAGGIILCNEDELAFWPNFENQGPRIFDEFQERLGKLK